MVLEVTQGFRRGQLVVLNHAHAFNIEEKVKRIMASWDEKEVAENYGTLVVDKNTKLKPNVHPQPFYRSGRW